MDDKSTLYELEFPAPQVTGDEGDGPVLVHALEGFADAGHAIKLASDHLRQSLESVSYTHLTLPTKRIV